MALKKMHLKIELADGTEHQVTIANPSLVAWDRTRATRKWPDSESAPMFWMTFLAWHALSVVAKKYDEKFEDFSDSDCLALEMVNDDGSPLADEGDVEDVDPTQPDLDSGLPTS